MCLRFYLTLGWLPPLLGRRSCVVGECDFPLWCGAKKHHAVLFLSGGVTDLPMASQTTSFFALKALTLPGAPPPEA